jgi:hypothetical protein
VFLQIWEASRLEHLAAAEGVFQAEYGVVYRRSRGVGDDRVQLKASHLGKVVREPGQAQEEFFQGRHVHGLRAPVAEEKRGRFDGAHELRGLDVG